MLVDSIVGHTEWSSEQRRATHQLLVKAVCRLLSLSSSEEQADGEGYFGQHFDSLVQICGGLGKILRLMCLKSALYRDPVDQVDLVNLYVCSLSSDIEGSIS